MMAERGALIIAIFILLFVAVSLVADMLPSFGVNVGPITGGIAPTQTKPSEKCKCQFNTDWQDFMCNKDCSDMSDRKSTRLNSSHTT
jgi:hypothetical protein